MTSQTCTVSLLSSIRGLKFSASCTDDSWTEVLDSVSSLGLGDVMAGASLTGFTGEYAAGGAVARIFNTQSNLIKAVFPLVLSTENKVYQFGYGVTIDQFDVLQVLSVEVPT